MAAQLVCSITPNEFSTKGIIQPTEISKDYPVRLVYRQHCSLAIRILDGKLKPRESGGKIKHTYGDGSLCLYFPKAQEWYFDKMMPLLKGPGNINTYTGIIAYELKSKKELLTFLMGVTEYCITELNAAKLYDSGKLTLTEQTGIKVLTSNRRLEIEALKVSRDPDSKVFLKLLRKWLKGEETFIGKLRKVLKPTSDNESLVQALCDCIRRFQQNDINEPCINNVRHHGPERESCVRFPFRSYLAARYPKAVIPAEEQNGSGRMDLKFYHPGMADKVIEFKGWWNFDKKDIARQVIGYLTDFEGEGYVVMINQLKSEIAEKYKAMVENPEMGYKAGSWTAHAVANTAFCYYSSIQLGARSKKLYHVIFNVYF